MKAQATQTKPAVKNTRRPVCQSCKKRFTTKVNTAKYCSTKCGDASRNKRKKVDPLEKALKSAFFYYLAGECLRAGTIEVLRGHTLETLCELHEVYKNNMKWNGYGGTSVYELSHIAPVKGHDFIGQLFAENLVSAPKSLNRAHGTRYYGFGKSLHRLSLNPKHSVNKSWNSPAEVVQLVINYLGKDLVLAVIKACKIKPTQRSQITEWIIDNYNPANDAHHSTLPDLDKVHDLKTRELEHVKAAMQGAETGEYISSPAAHPAIVMSQELTRLTAYRPELGIYAYALEDALATQGSDYSLFSKHHEQMSFDVLHGKSIAVMADTLEMVIGENTAHAFITYDAGYSRTLPSYHVDSFNFVQNPLAGAQLHRTSLTAFKAALGFDSSISNGSDNILDEITLHALPAAVFDPWGNEVEQPPF